MSEVNRIGIVGDGQLGRMLTEAALPLGYQVNTLGTAGPNSPAAQVGAHQMKGGLTDPEAIRRLAGYSDVITWEIEHIDTQTLIELEAEGANVQPSPRSLATIQDKLKQKRHLESRGLSVAPFISVEPGDDLDAARDKLGDRLIIKSRTGGYDGRGNLVLRGSEEWSDIESFFTDNEGNHPDLYAEEIIPFQRELAVIGARDMAGRVAVYPVVETIHENNICHMVLAPAEIDPSVRAAAEELGRETIKSFEGAGVFAVEMFQDENDNVLVNEVAPRVHNSGHYSIEGAKTSQFENHIRAITGLPLGETDMRASGVAMINILGTRDEKFSRRGLEHTLKLPDTHVHFYGKDPRPARKIGHITVLGSSINEAKLIATQARRELNL